ncbi:MAG: hypothetical protein EOP42_28795 [Sphingobacteriaceae bacterium]|nr:MAG: hypothetical protein EOP42_28795 [Sphingobacteriaceae bacterium]
MSLFKVHSQNKLSKCLKIDPSKRVISEVNFNGTLINMEMLPQGDPFIKDLEFRKRVLRNHHYYAILVKLNSCGITEWFTCGDNKFRPLNNWDSLKVQLTGINYGDMHPAGGLPLIINHITLQTQLKKPNRK